MLGPLPTLSDLFYVDVTLAPGARLQMSAEYPEQAIYITHGSLDLGKDGVHQAGQLLVLRPMLQSIYVVPARE